MALSIRGFSKSYAKDGERVHVLRGVTLNVEHGEVIALLGRSGVGKSTLLRSLAALEPIDEGDAWLDGVQYLAGGKPLLPTWQIARSVGMVFQDFRLFPNMRVIRNITLAAERVRGLSRRDAQALARRVADLLDVGDVLERYPSEISGGQAQRVALARALVVQPKVLALDEVTAALDPITVGTMIEALKTIREVEGAVGAKQQSAIILVTHALRFAESFADRIAFMADGVIVQDGPAREFRQSTNPSVAQYVSHVL